MKKKKFKIGDSFYEIPENEVSAFLSDNPDAVEVRSYNVKGQKYDVPVNEAAQFEAEMIKDLFPNNIPPVGLKKKEETQSSGISGVISNTIRSAKTALGKGEEDISALLPVNSTINSKQVGDTKSNFPKALPAVNVQGKYVTVLPKYIPDSYAKDERGAAQYANDLQSKIDAAIQSKDEAGYAAALKEAGRLSALLNLENNNSAVTIEDLEEINSIIDRKGNFFYEKPTPELLQLLKDKKSALIEKAVEDYSSKTKLPAYLISEKDGWIFGPAGSDPVKAPDISLYDKYIQKVGNSLQGEVLKSTDNNVQSADTRSTFRSIISSPIENVLQAESLLNSEKLGNSFFTGLEALKFKDESTYNKIVDRLQKGKTLASTEVANLTNEGAAIINARELEKLERNETDIESYFTKYGEVQKDLDDNFYKRKDILQQSIGKAIGEYYAKDGGVVVGKWFVSDKEIDAVPDSYFEQLGIDPTRPEVKAAKEEIKKNEGIMPFDNAIPKDDLLREFTKGFGQPLIGTANWLTGLVKSDNEKIVESRLQPITEYATQRTDSFNKKYGTLADAFSGAGQFVSQIMLMKGIGTGTGAIGKALGGSDDFLRVLAPGQAAPTLFREGTRLGNFVMDKSQVFGRLAAPFIQSYDANYKAALDRTDNPLSAKVMAFTNSAVESLSEQIFDNVKFGNQIVRDLRGINWNNVTRAFNRGTWDQIAQGQFRDALANSIKGSINKTLKTLGKAGVQTATGLAKEAFEEVPVQLSDFITSALANPNNVTNRELLPELADAFKSGLVSFSIPSLIGGGVSARRMFKNNQTQADALMLAATNRDSVLDAIYNQLQDGELSQAEADEKIKLLNTAASAVSTLPKRYSDGQPLTEEDRVRYLGLTINERYLKEEINEAQDEAINEINKKQIADITKQKEALLTKVPPPAPPSGGTPSVPGQSPAITSIAPQPDEDQIADAAQFINELKDGDLINEQEYAQAQKDPIAYFREVAQQANNIMDDGNFNTESDARQAAIDKYGETIIDYANELFPEFKEIASRSSVVETPPTVQSELTDEQRNRISEIEAKQEQLIREGKEKKQQEWDRLMLEGVDPAQAEQQANEYYASLPERNQFEQLESLKQGILSSVQQSVADENVIDGGAIQETVAPEIQPQENVREQYQQGRLESTEEPPPAKGRRVVTFSGLTEDERQQRIAERENASSGSINKVSNDLLDKIDQYNALPSGRAGKLKPEGIQLLNSIRNEASAVGLTFDNKTGRLKTKKGKNIKRPSAEARDRGIKEGAIVLRDRSDRTNEVFGQLLDAGIFPNSYDASNKQMNEQAVNGAIEDILDGIPSIRANNYLDQLDAAIEADSFEIGEGDQKRSVPLNELLNISTEEVGEPLTEQSITDWLNDDIELTPEQEQTVIDNIENLIEIYEDEQVDDATEVEPVEAASQTEGIASVESNAPAQTEEQKAERRRQVTPQQVADELRSILGEQSPLALSVNPLDRVSFSDIGITENDTIQSSIEKLIQYAPEYADIFRAIQADGNIGSINLQLVDNRRGLENGESGLYYPMGGQNGGLLQISNKDNVYYTFAHELMHYLTLDSAVAQQAKNTSSYKSLEDLYNYIASKKGKPVSGTATFENYALTNFKEFMAELLINDSFRDYVSDVFAENKEDIEKTSKQIKDSKVNGIGDLILNFFKDLFNRLIGSNNEGVQIDENIPVVESAARIATDLFFGSSVENIPTEVVLADSATSPSALPDLERNKKINDFVRKKLSQGISEIVIKDGLLMAGLSEQEADSFISEAKKKPDAAAKSKADENLVISKALSTPITYDQFPTIFQDNDIAKQQAAITQGEGQNRTVDGQYVVALESDLRDVALQTSALLESQLGGDWGLKTLEWIEQNPEQGNLAQIVGVLNVISTDIFQSINSTTDSKRLSRLKSIQNRIDVVSNAKARTASLTLRQRILYTKFAKGESVTDALAQTILAPEQLELVEQISESLSEEVTDEQINSSPDLRQSRTSPTQDQSPTQENSSLRNELINQGADTQNQRDANGNERKITFQDKIRQAKDKMDNLDCS